MTIFSGSRYAGVPVTGITGTDGKVREFLHDRRVFTKEDIGARAIEHVVVGGEQLDGLAERFYDDQALWWIIADVNEIFFALDLAPGDKILIPDKSVLRELGVLA